MTNSPTPEPNRCPVCGGTLRPGVVIHPACRKAAA